MNDKEQIEKGCGETIYSDNTPYAPSYSICRYGQLCKLCLKKLNVERKNEN